MEKESAIALGVQLFNLHTVNLKDTFKVNVEGYGLKLPKAISYITMFKPIYFSWLQSNDVIDPIQLAMQEKGYTMILVTPRDNLWECNFYRNIFGDCGEPVYESKKHDAVLTAAIKILNIN
jgi:hypothetical protein